MKWKCIQGAGELPVSQSPGPGAKKQEGRTLAPFQGQNHAGVRVLREPYTPQDAPLPGSLSFQLLQLPHPTIQL